MGKKNSHMYIHTHTVHVSNMLLINHESELIHVLFVNVGVVPSFLGLD